MIQYRLQKRIFMKILHVLPSLGVGGTERTVLELCRFQQKASHVPSVVALKSGGKIAEDLQSLGIQVHILGAPSAVGAGLLDCPRLLYRLCSTMRGQPPDILHSWLTRSNVFTRFALAGSSIPLLSSLRVVEKEKIWHHWAEYWTQSRSAKITVNSKELETFAEAEIGISKDKLVYIPNGVLPSPH